jgi:hypothetical protein
MTVPGRPNYARYYQASITGQACLPEDREVLMALREASIQPAVPEVENRAFLTRAVAHLAHDEGIRQFLDIGCGYPAWGNVHEVAGRFQSEAAVAYVDCDRDVVDRWRALMPDAGRVVAVERDLRCPRSILDCPEVCSLIDFNEPVGLLLSGVLHLVADEDDPAGIVDTLVDRLSPGSFLVVSQATGDSQDPATVAEVIRIASKAGVEITMRSREQATRFFRDVDLLEPGLVLAPDWRPARAPTHGPSGWIIGGAGRKP